MGGWRNGRRGGLKIRWPKGHEGSTPSPPTLLKRTGVAVFGKDSQASFVNGAPI